MKIKILFIILTIILIIWGCEEGLTENKNNTFKIVINAKGNSKPIDNADVNIWSKFHNSYSLPKEKASSEIQAATTIEFSLKQDSYVNLSMYDLDGKLTESLIKTKMRFGNYNVQFQNKIYLGTYVLKCKLSVYNDSLYSNTIFKDSIYITMVNPDPTLSVVGQTNSDGQLSITDKRLFPYFYNLPQMKRTNAGCSETIGYFSFTDTIIISIQGRYFEKQIHDGENIINLIWEEGESEYPWRRTSTKKTKNIISYERNIPQSIQAVELTYFNSERVDNGILLKWGTATEVNNYGFEIQKKETNWEIIGFVEGNNNSNTPKDYSFMDNTKNFQGIKYRLKQIDLNGDFEFSDSIQVYTVAENELYQNYPNPYN